MPFPLPLPRLGHRGLRVPFPWLGGVVVVCLLLGSCQGVTAPPLRCEQTGEQTVCIQWIKRSAKNHWEYRAGVTLDGIPQPPALYNCRTRRLTINPQPPTPFHTAGPGDLICRILKSS